MIMGRWLHANVKQGSPLPPSVCALKMARMCGDSFIKLMQTDELTEISKCPYGSGFFLINCQHPHLCVFCLCRTSTQCWISRQTQWIGWTTPSGIRLWCSWTQTPSRASRTWGPVSAQNLERVPESSLKDPSNYEKITCICLPVSQGEGGGYTGGSETGDKEIHHGFVSKQELLTIQFCAFFFVSFFTFSNH